MSDCLKGFVKGKVHDVIPWTKTEFSIRVQANIQPYIAGQFTKLALKSESGEWLRRAYSFVNSPNHDAGHTEMEFLLIDVERGNLSPKLARLTIGDPVYVGEQASGFMTLNEIPKTVENLWLLSTGTAIGPFLSILAESSTQKRFADIVLVHAVRTQQELVYQQLIQKFVNTYQGRLRYIPIVSREKITGTLSGRIPSLLLSDELFTATNIKPSTEKSFFYLCGNPDMVRDTKVALTTLGFSKHLRRTAGHFSSENYW